MKRIRLKNNHSTCTTIIALTLNIDTNFQKLLDQISDTDRIMSKIVIVLILLIWKIQNNVKSERMLVLTMIYRNTISTK